MVGVVEALEQPISIEASRQREESVVEQPDLSLSL
jgi:hypothetical protein